MFGPIKTSYLLTCPSASIAGSNENMRWNYLNFQIEKGDIKPDDYDYVVMSVDMLVEAALIRRQLKDRFPVKKKGTDRIIILR